MSAIDIHRAAFLRLVEHWRTLIKPLSDRDVFPEEADMSMLAAIRLCATKLAGTGSSFAYFTLEDARKDCHRFALCEWHLLSVNLLINALPMPDADEQALPRGQVRRLCSYWANIAPQVAHGTSAFRIWILEILWACRGLEDGMTAITNALYENVLDKILYVDESLALLFSRVNHSLTEDGGRLFANDHFRGQFLARLEDADRRGPEAFAGVFKYLDDAIAEQLAWAYGRDGRSPEDVSQIEAEERVDAYYERVVAALEKERRPSIEGHILFALGKRKWDEGWHDGLTLIRMAARCGVAEARHLMAEECLRKGEYRDAADYVYPHRNETKRDAALLIECFQKCQPGALDRLKWISLDADPETMKCLAADIDDLQSYDPGACGIKCNGEWAVGHLGREENDWQCPYTGHWQECPMYCGARERDN